MKRMIIDVREPIEYAAGHAKGAINIPPSVLMAGAPALEDIAKDTELILYCRTGTRANASIQILQQQGFMNLVNGINAAQVEAKYPAV